jgi:hypothetical protein
VLQKNEQYEAEMIDLLDWIHKYVPGHSENDAASKPVKVLSGGDYLTFERHKEAQSAMQDARTPSTRMEGLIPKTEDFHTQAEWTKVLLIKVLLHCATCLVMTNWLTNKTIAIQVARYFLKYIA